MAQVGVVGTTSWGTTLAVILARRGLDVRLWARTEDEAADLRAQGQNSRLVPGVEFPPDLSVTSDKADAFSRADLVIVAVPSRSLRDNVRLIGDALTGTAVMVSATKGLESASGMRMSQILAEELSPGSHQGICALSGPNLAMEIIQDKPSSTVVASESIDAAARAQSLMTSNLFRVYTNEDIAGVEFGGALKNIIGLGAGICDGLGFGDNAKAAFMTRGLAEITRLGVAGGANPLTFAGLAGMGDLVATCSSTLSRNHHVGEQLAKGKTLEETRSAMANVAEGVDTTAAAVLLADRLDVDMPITRATYSVLFDSVDLERAISQLLERAPTAE
jgi:glycerol-3-phosphate dehydrogenase (NAD(P)+)